MKQSISFLVAFFILSACSVTNRIVEIKDAYPEAISFRLVQNPKAYSGEMPGELNYKISNIYLFAEKNNERPETTVAFQVKSSVRIDKPDSAMYIVLDDEKIRIVSEEKGEQPMNCKYIVPENLWVSIVNSQAISYRFHLGKEGVEVRLNLSETAKLKEFFRQSIQRRDEKLRDIPEGHMKW